MLSYSHSKGLFAGVNLSGGSLTPDKDANDAGLWLDCFGAGDCDGHDPGAVSAEARGSPTRSGAKRGRRRV